VEKKGQIDGGQKTRSSYRKEKIQEGSLLEVAETGKNHGGRALFRGMIDVRGKTLGVGKKARGKD